MISIKVNGVYLTIDPGSGIDYTLVNSFFDDSLVEREFSLPFALPLDPVNRSALGFRERLDAVPRGKVIPCEVILNGTSRQAEIHVIRGSDEALEVNVKSIFIGILDRLGNTPLRDVMPTITVPDVLEDYGGIVIEPVVESGNVCRVYLNEIQYTSGLSLDKDTRGHELAASINAAYPGSTTYDEGTERLTIIPTWSPVRFGWTDSEVIIIHAFETPAQYWYRNYHAWVAQVNADTDAEFTFPWVQNFGYYNNNAAWTGKINPRDGIVYEEHGDLYTEAGQWRYSYSPWTKLLAPLTYIAAGVDGVDGFGGDVLEDEDVLRLIVSNIKPLDEVVLDNYPHDWDRLGQALDPITDDPLYLNHFKQTFNLADFIGDMSCREFLFLMAESLRLQMSYKHGVIYFRRKIDTVTLPIDRELPRFRGRPSIEYGEVRHWTLDLYRPNPDRDNTLWPASLGPLDIGIGGDHRTLAHGTLPMSALFADIGPRYPEINILHTDLPPGNKGLLLLLWYGIQPGWQEETEYAFASSGYINEQGDEVGTMSLDLQDEKSIYNRFLKGTYQYDDSDTVTDEGLYAPHEIDEETWFRGRVKGYSQRGEYTGIIRSIAIRVTARGEMVATFEIAKQRL